MKTVALFLVCWLMISTTAHAQTSRPFQLTCPDLNYCGRGEAGDWLPKWQSRALLTDVATLQGVQKELVAASAELASRGRIVDLLKIEVSRLQALDVQSQVDVRNLRAEVVHEHVQKQRRTRWAVGATIVGTALITIFVLSKIKHGTLW